MKQQHRLHFWKCAFGLVLMAATMTLTSCRKDGDMMASPNLTSPTCFVDQFEAVWNGINSSYSFWDVDPTDWDAVHDKYLPKFQALDKRRNSVTNNELKALYDEMTSTLVDHHMAIIVRNLGNDSLIRISPANHEITSRNYWHAKNSESQMICADLEANAHTTFTVTNYQHQVSADNVNIVSCRLTLPDGRFIPYLHMTGYRMCMYIKATETTPITAKDTINKKAGEVILAYLNDIQNTPRAQLAGIILDNRCNTGGAIADLEYVLGAYINEPVTPFETRYKEGIGRLDYTPWIPSVVNPSTRFHRDITAENIPYVILCDLNSVSMGEITTLSCASMLPTCHTIGERTYGANGPLYPEYYDYFFCGPFGSQQGNVYVYTSTFALRPIGGSILEGIGYTPHEVLLYNEVGLAAQLDRAVAYISSH